MAISIPRALVEFVLLGPTHDRRQLQDSPILGDVWLAFAAAPDQPLELLIAPDRDAPSGTVAIEIDKQVKRTRKEPGANIAPLHGIVAARLYFREVVSIVVPMTGWWNSRRIQDPLHLYADDAEPVGRSDVPTQREI